MTVAVILWTMLWGFVVGCEAYEMCKRRRVMVLELLAVAVFLYALWPIALLQYEIGRRNHQ